MPVEQAGKPTGAQRRHLVIAGTGRAGTSFLVQFLDACGLDVGAEKAWIPRARAGMEHFLLDDEAPYVVKDPWLFAYCNQIDLDKIAIDALVVPMRELMAAAESRVFQERMALAETEWRSRPLTEVRGGADGGVIYSLDPTDQARILSVGFYRLIHWAVTKEIPLVLLEFPRLVEDGDYLVRSLLPWLESHCTATRAKQAFAATALASEVRIEAVQQDQSRRSESSDVRSAERAAIVERNAMAALLDERIRSADERLAEMHKTLLESENALTQSRHDLSRTQTNLSEVQQSLASEMGRLSQSEQMLDVTRVRLTESELAISEQQSALGEAGSRLAALQTEYDALTRSRSWRATRPLRALRRVGRRPHSPAQ